MPFYMNDKKAPLLILMPDGNDRSVASRVKFHVDKATANTSAFRKLIKLKHVRFMHEDLDPPKIVDNLLVLKSKPDPKPEPEPEPDPEKTSPASKKKKSRKSKKTKSKSSTSKTAASKSSSSDVPGYDDSLIGGSSVTVAHVDSQPSEKPEDSSAKLGSAEPTPGEGATTDDDTGS
jgi:hypothetical protein